jgi:hypothetical protein
MVLTPEGWETVFVEAKRLGAIKELERARGRLRDTRV